MKDSSFGRLIGVFIHPTKTFLSIAERPNWWPPALALLVVGVVYVALLIPRIDWNEYTGARYGGSGEISAEQLAARVEMLEESGYLLLWIAVPVVFLVVFPLMAWLFYRALKVFGSEMSFLQGFAVTLYGLLPSWGLGGLLTLPLLMAKGRAEVNPAEFEGRDLLWSNPAFLAGDGASPALLTLLSSLDVFSLWSLALLTIGFSLAGRVSKGQAATCVVGMWLLYVAAMIGLRAVGIVV